jgi:hypothetical protein
MQKINIIIVMNRRVVWYKFAEILEERTEI